MSQTPQRLPRPAPPSGRPLPAQRPSAQEGTEGGTEGGAEAPGAIPADRAQPSPGGRGRPHRPWPGSRGPGGGAGVAAGPAARATAEPFARGGNAPRAPAVASLPGIGRACALPRCRCRRRRRNRRRRSPTRRAEDGKAARAPPPRAGSKCAPRRGPGVFRFRGQWPAGSACPWVRAPPGGRARRLLTMFLGDFGAPSRGSEEFGDVTPGRVWSEARAAGLRAAGPAQGKARACSARKGRVAELHTVS